MPSTRSTKDQSRWRLIESKAKEKERTMEGDKVKAQVEAKEKDTDAVTALAEDAGKKKDAVAEKDEEEDHKEKENTLDKYVRKVTEEKVSLVEKQKDLSVTTVAKQDTLHQSVIPIQEKENPKEKERAFAKYTESTTKIEMNKSNGMIKENGRTGTVMDNRTINNLLVHQAKVMSGQQVRQKVMKLLDASLESRL